MCAHTSSFIPLTSSSMKSEKVRVARFFFYPFLARFPFVDERPGLAILQRKRT